MQTIKYILESYCYYNFDLTQKLTFLCGGCLDFSFRFFRLALLKVEGPSQIPAWRMPEAAPDTVAYTVKNSLPNSDEDNGGAEQNVLGSESSDTRYVRFRSPLSDSDMVLKFTVFVAEKIRHPLV